VLAVAFFLVSMFFVRKSFYGMRIESRVEAPSRSKVEAAGD
jgi:hypothetical protein